MKVVITRSIEAGCTYRINSSYGYDIASGMVVVDAVIAGYDESIKKDVLNWMEIHTQSMDKDDKFEHREAILSDVYDMVAGHWVRYTYTDGRDNDRDSQLLPIQLFADHLSIQ